MSDGLSFLESDPSKIAVLATRRRGIHELERAEDRRTFEYVWEEKRYDLPCIHLQPGDHRLWGMTFRMLETLLEALR